MELTPVKSSNVEAVGFDPATGTLIVKYKSGGVYHYSGCRQSHFDDCVNAESVGKYLHKNIKGQFKHKKGDAS